MGGRGRHSHGNRRHLPGAANVRGAVLSASHVLTATKGGAMSHILQSSRLWLGRCQNLSGTPQGTTQPDPNLSMPGVLPSRGTGRTVRQMRGTRRTARRWPCHCRPRRGPCFVQSLQDWDGDRRKQATRPPGATVGLSPRRSHTAVPASAVSPCVTLAADTTPHARYRRAR